MTSLSPTSLSTLYPPPLTSHNPQPNYLGCPIIFACNCLTELILKYLDHVPLPIHDTNRALCLFNSFSSHPGPSEHLFALDIKCLYTVISHNKVPLAYKHFLDFRPDLQSDMSVFSLNCFSFARGFTKSWERFCEWEWDPTTWTCLATFEAQIFSKFTGLTPKLYGHYIDDCIGATLHLPDHFLPPVSPQLLSLYHTILWAFWQLQPNFSTLQIFLNLPLPSFKWSHNLYDLLVHSYFPKPTSQLDSFLCLDCLCTGAIQNLTFTLNRN